MKVLFICALKEESDGYNTLFDFPIVHTGVGKINAGYKTAMAILEHKPDLVCNFGSCGSFTMEKGMLLKVRDVYNGDMDAEPLVPYSITPFDQDGDYLHIENEGVSCFTSETFITPEKVKTFPPKKLELLNKCSIFEMELYSITRVCKEFNVPIVSYKWVSDDGGMDDWEKNCRIGYSQFKLEFYNKYIAV
jgi:adenosylhomocysteine nucleosidase